MCFRGSRWEVFFSSKDDDDNITVDSDNNNNIDNLYCLPNDNEIMRSAELLIASHSSL